MLTNKSIQQQQRVKAQWVRRVAALLNTNRWNGRPLTQYKTAELKRIYQCIKAKRIFE